MHGLFCGCGIKMLDGVHVYDWMNELYISMHEAPYCRGTSCQKGVVIVRTSNCCHGTKVDEAKIFLSKAT